MVDTDPQASLTQTCGVGDVAGQSLAEVLGGATPGAMPMANIVQDLGNGLSLAPSDISLSSTELGLTSRLGRENVLKKTLASVGSLYDVCIIDCPPSLGLLTVGALVAADAVLIPTLPQVVDLRGLRQFLEITNSIKSELNPDLEILGVLVTFYDRRLNHHKAAIETMRSAGIPLLPVYIGRSVRVAEAAGEAQSVTEFAPRNPQAENYKQLSEVIKSWVNQD
jgi:chromosome partitioning protein